MRANGLLAAPSKSGNPEGASGQTCRQSDGRRGPFAPCAKGLGARRRLTSTCLSPRAALPVPDAHRFEATRARERRRTTLRPPHLAAAFAVLLAATLAAPAARAHVVSDLEVGVLQRLPPGLITRTAAAAEPDPTGAVGENRGAWKHVGDQSPALRLLADASARHDSLAAEREWKAIDLAFAHQRPDGGFVHAPFAGYADSLSEVLGVARWAAATCRAFVVVMNGPMQNAFRLRYVLTLRKLEVTLHFLEAREPELEVAHVRHGPEMLLLAQTFLLGDGTFHVESFGRLGQRCLARALMLQRRDGAFPHDADVTLGAQAQSLESLESVAQYFPSPMLDRATDLVAGWIARQLDAKGAWASGSSKSEQDEALAALAYHAERRGDAALKKATALAFSRFGAHAAHGRSSPKHRATSR